MRILFAVLGAILVSASVMPEARADWDRHHRGTWVCGSQSSRGYNYQWESPYRDDAEAQSMRTCRTYEDPYGGYCYAPNCYQKGGHNPDPYPRPMSWLCSSWSNRGYNYQWKSPYRHDAEYHALRTCQAYESQWGYSCAAPTCTPVHD